MDLDIFDLRFAFLSSVVMADGEDDDEGEDEDDESADDEESSEETGGRKKSDPRVKAANDEAKKHRLRAKELARQIREMEKQEEAKAEKEKPEIDRLKGEVSRLQDRVRETDDLRLRVLVLEKAVEYKVSGSIDDIDFIEYKLRKQGVLKLDEEGDPPEEFEDAVKKLAKGMTADSEKDSADERDRSDDGEKPTPPRSPRLSGKKKEKEPEMNALARRFPALTQRSPV